MHPWFKVSADCSAIIRVENPQHVRIFNGNDPLIRGLEWKAALPKESGVTEEKPGDDQQQGNRYFVDKNYLKAVEAYSKAIQAQPQNAILYSNRAATYLRMEKSEEALQDTEIGLNLQPSNVKLLYRKAKALIQLKRYEEAASFLEKSSEEHKEAMKEKELANLVKASKWMMEEAKWGKYDIMAMMEEKKRSPLLDNHADYHAMDKFQIKQVPGKGRGLVAKEKIEAGTLLIACKAFVFAQVSSEASVTLAKTMETVTFEAMVRKASEKLMNNPELCDEFYKLYAGKELGYLEKADHLDPVDIARIWAIIRLNRFADEGSLIFDGKSPLESHQTGLWMMPAYLNHSCVDCNCFRHVIGDFMLIRATREINPGDELLLEYVSGTDDYEHRRQVLNYQFGIECSCRLCQADRNQPEETRKRLIEIRKTMAEMQQHGQKEIDLLKSMLKEAKEYHMEFSFVADLSPVALFSTSPAAAHQISQELFEICKSFNDLGMAMIYAKDLIKTSAFKGDREVAKWVKTTKKLAKIMYGDERVVDLMKF